MLDKGTLSDIGTHDELMERSEIYREVYRSQNRARNNAEGGVIDG